MRKFLVMFILPLLAGCGSSSGGSNSSAPAPTSIFSGKNVDFYYGLDGSTFTGVLALDASGTFNFDESYPVNCSNAGSWKDTNPGGTSGQLRLTFTLSGCGDLAGTVSVLNYVVSNGTAEFN